jgi:hypothetical protein
MHLGAQNAELNDELAGFVGGDVLVLGIKSALGASATESLSAEAHPVLGYFWVSSDELFRSFFLTPSRFVVFEMLRDGTSLSVTVPLSRVSRVAESRSAEVVMVSIELDADMLRVRSNVEYAEMAQANEEGVRSGQMAALSEIARASYDLSEVIGSENETALSEFSRRLRMSMER